MSKHTPAPWSHSWISGALRHISRNVDRDSFWFPDENEDAETANFPSYYTEGDVDLIASAPELLEALKIAVSELYLIHSQYGDKEHARQSCHAIKYGEEVIAKAEGK